MVIELELKDNNFLRQFEVNFDGHLAKIEYSLQERKIFLTKIILPETLKEDLEFKNLFLREVFNNIQERKLKVVPTSPVIAGFIRKNKEYKELLPVGIKL